MTTLLLLFSGIAVTVLAIRAVRRRQQRQWKKQIDDDLARIWKRHRDASPETREQAFADMRAGVERAIRDVRRERGLEETYDA